MTRRLHDSEEEFLWKGEGEGGVGRYPWILKPILRRKARGKKVKGEEKKSVAETGENKKQTSTLSVEDMDSDE